MAIPEVRTREVNRLSAGAGAVFLTVEVLAYVVLGVMLAIAVLVGVGGAAVSLWRAILARGETGALVLAVDRLLFVLMVVEVMHTVRVSFRSGRLVCEPFLIVGLIASIRRVLVITLETSQAHEPGKWSLDAQALLGSTMLELTVLGGLILVMVISIYLLRRSDREQAETSSAPGSA
ncbi:phosphate-starvation-inducible PsiE family protein [Phenylobacterium sp.]|uniref:phosphate-starvation-inducible PsiE family protein n=1 Tax=Phenylobacterium sp. TaxID=1871053 RepID=UPI0025F3F820|nr:phosphate-starvation-inducible PsiE family protein [Phenylobacterium sp.]